MPANESANKWCNKMNGNIENSFYDRHSAFLFDHMCNYNSWVENCTCESSTPTEGHKHTHQGKKSILQIYKTIGSQSSNGVKHHCSELEKQNIH